MRPSWIFSVGVRMCFLRLTEQEPMGSHSTKLSFDCSYAIDISSNANSTFIFIFSSFDFQHDGDWFRTK